MPEPKNYCADATFGEKQSSSSNINKVIMLRNENNTLMPNGLKSAFDNQDVETKEALRKTFIWKKIVTFIWGLTYPNFKTFVRQIKKATCTLPLKNAQAIRHIGMYCFPNFNIMIGSVLNLKCRDVILSNNTDF